MDSNESDDDPQIDTEEGKMQLPKINNITPVQDFDVKQEIDPTSKFD
jgi:hypothetical protein